MINGAPPAKAPGAVEAVLALCLGQRPSDALQADPMGADCAGPQHQGVIEVPLWCSTTRPVAIDVKLHQWQEAPTQASG
jgi:hypothetical protein